jgi:PKD repeat protein
MKNYNSYAQNIVIVTILFFLCFSKNSYSQTIYYSKAAASSSLNLVSSWGVNTDGSGASPANFTTASCTFSIVNTATASIAGAWTVSGAGSKIVVGPAVSFTVPSAAAYTGTVDVSNTATLTLLHTTIPTMGDLSVGSTICYSRLGAQSVRNANYYNLIIDGTGQKALLSTTNTAISNSLIINSGNTLQLNTVNTVSCTINGNVSGGGALRGNANANLIISGTGDAGLLTFTTTTSLYKFIVSTNGSVSLGSNLTVSNAFEHTNGTIDLNGKLLTLNGLIAFPANASDGSFIGSSTSSLSVAGTTTAIISNELQMDQSNSITKSLGSLSYNRVSQNLVLGSDLIIESRFTHTAGMIDLNGKSLTLNGIITFPSNATTTSSLTCSSSSSLIIAGTGAIGNTLKIDQTNSATKTLSSFNYSRSGVSLTFGNSLIINSQFTHSDGTLSIGATSIELNGDITFPVAATSGAITGSTTSSLTIAGSGTIVNSLFMTPTNTATRALNYFSLNRAGSTLSLGNALIVSSLFEHNNGSLNLNGQLLTFNGNIIFTASAINGDLIGSTTSSISIATNTAATISNSLYMNQSSSINKSLGYLSFNRVGQTLALGSDLIVGTTFLHTNGIFDLNGKSLTLNGTITFPASAATNGSLTGSPSSSLSIGGSGVISQTLKINQATSATQTFNSFIYNRAGVNLTFGNNAIISGQFTHTNGTLSIGATSLTLNGNVTFPASISNGAITGSATSSLTIGGSGSISNSLFMTQTSTTTRTFNNFLLDRSGIDLTLGNALISNVFTQTNGNINLNGQLLTLNNIITFPASSSNGFFIGSSTSSLSIAGAGVISNSMFMDQTSSSTKSMSSLLLNRTGQTLTLGNNLNIIDVMTPTLGTFASAGFLTLKATSAAQVGRIGVVGGSVTGNVTVESFASAGSTGWTTLGAAGVTSATFADWNDDFGITCASCPNGTGGGFTSINSYNEAAGGVFDNAARYVDIANITDAITTAKGYWVYLGNGATTTSDIVIDVTGPINQGNKVIPLSYTSSGGGTAADWGYNFIANPYPSPISWSLLRAGNTRVSDAIYVYNPDIGGFAECVAGVSNPAVGAGGIGNMIPAGQGFYVKVSAATSITARETNKAASTQVLLRSSQSSSFNPKLIRLRAAGQNMHHETVLYFSPQSSSVYETEYDALSLGVDLGRLEITSVLHDTIYGINGLEDLTQSMSIPIKVKTGTTGTYQILAEDFQSIPSGACLILHDNLTNANHDLRNGAYTCTISASESTIRFVLNVSVVNDITVSSTITDPSCAKLSDGFIVANTSEAGIFNYYWKDENSQLIKTSLNVNGQDTLKNVSNGNYSVDIAISGTCRNGSESLQVLTQPNIVAYYTALSNNVVFNNDTAQVSFVNASLNADSYYWLFGDGEESNETNPIHNYTTIGTHSVTLFAINSVCGDTMQYTSTINVEMNVTGINNISNESLNNISINRDAEGYYVALNDKKTNAVVSVWNLLGEKKCNDIVINNNSPAKVYIPLGETDNAILIITVTTEDNVVVYRKLLNN